jgi:hypothetical protein
MKFWENFYAILGKKRKNSGAILRLPFQRFVIKQSLKQFVGNPTGFLTLEAQLLGNGFKEILFSKFLTKGEKLPKKSQLWR